MASEQRRLQRDRVEETVAHLPHGGIVADAISRGGVWRRGRGVAWKQEVWCGVVWCGVILSLTTHLCDVLAMSHVALEAYSNHTVLGRGSTRGEETL